jgi:hypothetical protein
LVLTFPTTLPIPEFSKNRCQQKIRWRASQCIILARDCQRPEKRG